jgi:hypothetical protein
VDEVAMADLAGGLREADGLRLIWCADEMSWLHVLIRPGLLPDEVRR